MKATLNSLNLKKGNKVFLFGNWNGDADTTVDFYVQEYTIHSIGKKRCYFLINEDINSKKEYNCANELNIALSAEQVLEDCKNYIPEYVTREIKQYEWKIESWGHRDKYYATSIGKLISNLNTAPKRIIINPYSSDIREIINL